MIVDLHELDALPGEGPPDVCICGGGVAGITLALELAQRQTVLLLEGGGMQVSGDSQEPYVGSSAGRDYFDLRATRPRCLGGSSNHWAGWCVGRLVGVTSSRSRITRCPAGRSGAVILIHTSTGHALSWTSPPKTACRRRTTILQPA